MKVSNEILIESYSRLGNIWKVGEEVGLCGQSVQERLVRLGIKRKLPVFTEEEKELLVKEYSNYLLRGELNLLAKQMNRTKPFICRKAKQLGLTDIARKKKDLKNFVPVIKPGHWDTHEHPRGMKGLKHSDETKKIISGKSILSQKEINDSGRRSEVSMKMMKSRVESGNYAPERQKTTWKSGWRTIGGITKYFRSRWEANYARYLQYLKENLVIKNWEHEAEAFWFGEIKKGCFSYLPDFRITRNDNLKEYHEVKGWMDDRSLLKISRMGQYHPDIKMEIVRGDWFKINNNQLSTIINDWE